MLEQWREELREQLERWSGRCPLCHLRQETEQQHQLQDCRFHDEAARIWKKFQVVQKCLKGRSDKSCFHCGLLDTPEESGVHSHLSGEWQGFKEGEWTCRYKGVALLVFLTILQECKDPNTTCELVSWMEDEDIGISREETPSVWLGEMTSLTAGVAGPDVLVVLKVFHRFARAISIEDM